MDYALGWNRPNLTVLGVWPEPNETTRGWRAMASFLFWSSSVVTILSICMPRAASLVLKSEGMDDVIENLSINVPVVFTVIKQGTLRYYRKELAALLADMLKDWSAAIPYGERKLMLKHAKTSRTISIICTTWTWLMLSLFISYQINTNLSSSSDDALRGLIHPATFPYDVSRSPNFEITFSGQLASTILTIVCYSSFDTFVAVLVLHLCGQLAVLRLNLRQLAQDTRSDAEVFDQRIRYIVDKHEKLYRYVIVVEKCFNLILLAQTLISTAMFCLTGYRMITSVDQDQGNSVIGFVFFIVHVTYTILHLFIHCYVGEALLVESTEVAESTYECEWYDLPPRKVVYLTIILCRARIPFQITAGKFSPFSLEFFGSIMKTSAGYLSVLLAMKDRLIEE